MLYVIINLTDIKTLLELEVLMAVTEEYIQSSGQLHFVF